MRIVRIGNINDDYTTVLSELRNALLQRKLLPFTGAGISIENPTCLPGAFELSTPLVDAMWSAVSVYSGYKASTEKQYKVLQNARLERLLDVVYKTHGEKAIEYLHILFSTNWNKNHACLAELAHNNLLPWCITLNFDLLIEYAIKAKDAGSNTICPLTNSNFRMGLPEITKIIKPHGSFVPVEISDNPYKYLSATLSQIGDFPDQRNIQTISQSVRDCPVLLVAGYSNDDWDIFPILMDLSNQFRHVYWIEYLSSQDKYLSADKLLNPIDCEKKAPKPNKKVQAWLSSIETKSTLIFGASAELLKDLLDIVIPNHQMKEPTEVRTPNQNLTNYFRGSLNESDEKTIRNLISFATLIQHSGEFSYNLLSWLSQSRTVSNNTEYSSMVEYLLAHTHHTKDDMSLAIQHMKKSIRLKKSPSANDFIWLGYEYLCLAKRPKRPVIVWIMVSLPFVLIRGTFNIFKGIYLASYDQKEEIRTKAQYYFIDLIHSWGTLLVIFNNKVSRLRQLYFSLVTFLYDGISGKTPFMQEDYYWLRILESKLLSGKDVEDIPAIKKKLMAIEDRYRILQNNVQLGNIQVYQGLIAFCIEKDKTKALDLLNEAQTIWEREGNNISSGRRRIEIFRRFFEK